MPHVTPCVVFKGSTARFQARLLAPDASNLQRADVETITYTIYALDPANEDTQTAVEGHEDVALTVADVVWDALQTDARWTVDTTGYNFAATIDISTNAAFAVRGTKYLVEFVFTPPTGQAFKVQFRALVI